MYSPVALCEQPRDNSPIIIYYPTGGTAPGGGYFCAWGYVPAGDMVSTATCGATPGTLVYNQNNIWAFWFANVGTGAQTLTVNGTNIMAQNLVPAKSYFNT